MKRWLSLSQLARTEKVRQSGAGYTVIEIIVVLAVTTSLFVAIAITFNGQQSKTEFNQSVRQLEAKLQNIISDVRTGYYPNGIGCIKNAAGPVQSGTANPGANSDCIFVGKIWRPDDSTGFNRSQIKTLVGLRTDSITNDDVTDLSQAKPAVFGPDELYSHPFNIEIFKMYELNTLAQIYGIGFVYRLSGGISSGNSGSDPVRLYRWNSSANVPSPVTLGSFQPAPQGILLCVRRGANDLRAEIRIGTSTSQTTIQSTLNTPNSGMCRD